MASSSLDRKCILLLISQKIDKIKHWNFLGGTHGISTSWYNHNFGGTVPWQVTFRKSLRFREPKMWIPTRYVLSCAAYLLICSNWSAELPTSNLNVSVEIHTYTTPRCILCQNHAKRDFNFWVPTRNRWKYLISS